jgi:ElaB/YqjD/DUF883 family membrane-anchored ribosome-binding protein
MDSHKADLAQLREDILALGDAVRDTASESVTAGKAKTQERLQRIWEDFEGRFEDLLQDGKATFSRAEQKLSEHPTGSVLTAFGLGYLIAKVLDGGRR